MISARAGITASLLLIVAVLLVAGHDNRRVHEVKTDKTEIFYETPRGEDVRHDRDVEYEHGSHRHEHEHRRHFEDDVDHHEHGSTLSQAKAKVTEAGSRLADKAEAKYYEAKAKLSRSKSEDVRDRVSDKVESNYYDAKDKLADAGESVSDTYYDVKAKLSNAGDRASDKVESNYHEAKSKLADAGESVSDTYYDTKAKLSNAGDRASDKVGSKYYKAKDKVSRKGRKVSDDSDDNDDNDDSEFKDWSKWDVERVIDYFTHNLHLRPKAIKNIVRLVTSKKITGAVIAKWLEDNTDDSKFLDFLSKHMNIDAEEDRHAVLGALRRLPKTSTHHKSLVSRIRHFIVHWATKIIFSPITTTLSTIWFVVRLIGLGGICLTLLGATGGIKNKANADIIRVHDKYMSWIGYYEGKIQPVGAGATAAAPRVPNFLLSACYFLGYPLSIAYCYLKHGFIASAKLVLGLFGVLMVLSTFMSTKVMGAIWSLVYLAMDFSGVFMVIMFGWLIKQWITTPPKSASVTVVASAPLPLSPRAEKLKLR